MLSEMYSWCKKWCLKVNESKSEVMQFRNSRHKCTKYNFEYGDSPFDKVTKKKYLGILLDEHLNFL